jgi:hypothetical protein
MTDIEKRLALVAFPEKEISGRDLQGVRILIKSPARFISAM